MTKGFESLLMFSKLKDFWTLAHVFIGQIVFWGLAHAFRGAKDELFFGALAHAFRGPMILDPSSFVQRPRIFRSYLMFSEDLGFLVLWLMFSKDQRFDFNLPEVIHAVQEAETFPSIRSIFKDLALSFARVQSRRTLEVCPIIMVLFKDCSSFDKKYLIVTKESNDAKEVDMNAS
nr:hypothetical protein CFP56_13530 [Quercus suber]